jgi:uncharacterized membrane protein YagU involved in acid resistance
MNAKRAVAAGVIATAVMTSLLLVEPSIGLPRIAIGVILSSVMSAVSSHAAIGAFWGWVLDVLLGIVFALVYAGYLVKRLPGGAFVRGLLFGCMVFVLAQLVFAPMTGTGVFSNGDLELLAGGLLGHLVFGGVLGYVYGEGDAPSPQLAPQA